jgi:hypothetical protein
MALARAALAAGGALTWPLAGALTWPLAARRPGRWRRA